MTLYVPDLKTQVPRVVTVSGNGIRITPASTQTFVRPMINYLIEAIDDGYMLTVWEPAPLTNERVKPFFFKANYIISSPLEAFGLLKLIQGGKGSVRSPVPGQLAKSLMNHHHKVS